MGELKAIAASATDARLLGIPAGAPLLAIRRVEDFAAGPMRPGNGAAAGAQWRNPAAILPGAAFSLDLARNPRLKYGKIRTREGMP
ncbi:MAG TPA: hypothetical protein VFR34_04075 [Paracoccaceae bacterium]|nr:hypothetical protein [Paracoccaceae bacterium]